jgi:hypothetical protein
MGRLPNGEEEAKRVIELVKSINETNKSEEKITVEEIDEAVIRNTAQFATASLSPMAAFFGGIIA